MSRHVGRFIAPVVAVLLLAACTRRSVLDVGVRDTITDLIQPFASLTLEHCGALFSAGGPSRSAACEADATTAEMEAIVQGLALEAIAAEGIPPNATDEECHEREGFSGGGVLYYYADGRPTQLPGMERMLVAFNPSMGRACVQIEYAYG